MIAGGDKKVPLIGKDNLIYFAQHSLTECSFKPLNKCAVGANQNINDLIKSEVDENYKKMTTDEQRFAFERAVVIWMSFPNYQSYLENGGPKNKLNFKKATQGVMNYVVKPKDGELSQILVSDQSFPVLGEGSFLDYAADMILAGGAEGVASLGITDQIFPEELDELYQKLHKLTGGDGELITEVFRIYNEALKKYEATQGKLVALDDLETQKAIGNSVLDQIAKAKTKDTEDTADDMNKDELMGWLVRRYISDVQGTDSVFTDIPEKIVKNDKYDFTKEYASIAEARRMFVQVEDQIRGDSNFKGALDDLRKQIADFFPYQKISEVAKELTLYDAIADYKIDGGKLIINKIELKKRDIPAIIIPATRALKSIVRYNAIVRLWKDIMAGVPKEKQTDDLILALAKDFVDKVKGMSDAELAFARIDSVDTAAKVVKLGNIFSPEFFKLIRDYAAAQVTAELIRIYDAYKKILGDKTFKQEVFDRDLEEYLIKFIKDEKSGTVFKLPDFIPEKVTYDETAGKYTFTHGLKVQVQKMVVVADDKDEVKFHIPLGKKAEVAAESVGQGSVASGKKIGGMANASLTANIKLNKNTTLKLPSLGLRFVGKPEDMTPPIGNKSLYLSKGGSSFADIYMFSAGFVYSFSTDEGAKDTKGKTPPIKEGSVYGNAGLVGDPLGIPMVGVELGGSLVFPSEVTVSAALAAGKPADINLIKREAGWANDWGICADGSVEFGPYKGARDLIISADVNGCKQDGKDGASGNVNAEGSINVKPVKFGKPDNKGNKPHALRLFAKVDGGRSWLTPDNNPDSYWTANFSAAVSTLLNFGKITLEPGIEGGYYAKSGKTKGNTPGDSLDGDLNLVGGWLGAAASLNAGKVFQLKLAVKRFFNDVWAGSLFFKIKTN